MQRLQDVLVLGIRSGFPEGSRHVRGIMDMVFRDDERRIRKTNALANFATIKL